MRACLFCFVAGLIGTPLTASARSACDGPGRASLGAGVAAAGMNVPISSSIEPYRVGEQVLASGGPALTVNTDVSLPQRWGIRAETTVGRVHVSRIVDGPGFARRQSSRRIGQVVERELLVGVRRYAPFGPRVCGYGALLFGAYRYSYAGITSRTPGGAGILGLGGPVGSVSPYFEVRLGAAETQYRPPLAAYEAFHGSVTVGFRRRW
jgi:hypothetical protein